MTTFMLKIIGLILMTLDHTKLFFQATPVWFGWVGRLAAPIFVFTSIQGFHYTSDKKKYLLRLYIASVAMGIIQYLLRKNSVTYGGFSNFDMNIFRTLFIINVFNYLVDVFREERDQFKGAFIRLLIWQVGSTIICLGLLMFTRADENFVTDILSSLFGSLFYLEGGLIFVALGVLLYAFRDSKRKIGITYIIFCAIYAFLMISPAIPRALYYIYLIPVVGDVISDILEFILNVFVKLSPMDVGGTLLENYQWMMIFALPFFLIYNNERGPKVKYFFYLYFPVHIMILAFIAG